MLSSAFVPLLVRCVYLLQFLVSSNVNDFANANSSVYTYTENGQLYAKTPYSLTDVFVSITDKSAHDRLLKELLPSRTVFSGVNTSFFVQQPVYITLTTMASRIYTVDKSIISLIQARVVPHKIYLVISKDAYLLDEGVKIIPDNLLCLVAAGYLSVVYSVNYGPHRKLLPVLKRYWGQDVFIATVDDDMGQAQGHIILYQLLKTHVLNNRTDAVVALRARRISICNKSPHRATKYHTWFVAAQYGVTEMLVMPTGTGGILYKPAYFPSAVFLKTLRHATGTADDLMFRLTTMMQRVPVLLGCSMMYHTGRVVRACKEDREDRRFFASYGARYDTVYKTMLAEVLEEKQQAQAAKEALLLRAKESQEAEGNRLLQVAMLRSHNHVPATTSKSTEQPQTPTSRVLAVSSGASNKMKRSFERVATTSDKDLFSINRRGGNDYAWRSALEVLKMHDFSFETLATEFMSERGDACWQTKPSLRCGLIDCQKGKGITGNSTVTTDSVNT